MYAKVCKIMKKYEKVCKVCTGIQNFAKVCKNEPSMQNYAMECKTVQQGTQVVKFAEEY